MEQTQAKNLQRAAVRSIRLVESESKMEIPVKNSSPASRGAAVDNRGCDGNVFRPTQRNVF